ncbi:MAG: hypothetical protein OXG99_13940 [Alphaproteobacteria bacterium]|nr:hypothetical protein [Alphaproteobacteria bacterium]
MDGDAYWTVDILLPYYTGEQRWRCVHGGTGEELARRMLDAERRNGNRARLRRWQAEVVDADEAYDLAGAVPVPRTAGGLDNTIPF